MRTIVDSCVWSLALRRRPTAPLSQTEQNLVHQLRDLIRSRGAVIIGPIRQEVLSGIRDLSLFTSTEEILEPFPDAEIATPDYIEAARLFNLCRSHGVACGPIDILLCAVAVRLKLDILTYDQGLKRCIEVLRTDGLEL